MLLRIERHRQGFLSIVDKHFHAEPVQHDPKPEVPIPAGDLCAANVCPCPACPGHRAVKGQQRLLRAVDQICVMLFICRQGEDDCPLCPFDLCLQIQTSPTYAGELHRVSPEHNIPVGNGVFAKFLQLPDRLLAQMPVPKKEFPGN